MTEQKIEVNTITKDPEIVFYQSIIKIAETAKGLEPVSRMDLLHQLSIMRDAFEEYKLQANSTIL